MEKRIEAKGKATGKLRKSLERLEEKKKTGNEGFEGKNKLRPLEGQGKKKNQRKTEKD